jgi:hypothetical protein
MSQTSVISVSKQHHELTAARGVATGALFLLSPPEKHTSGPPIRLIGDPVVW